ncbi:hypothetical protein A9P82_03390 [Arachidicoccus ginsenosidimutans]|uniref:hypothetical protein n=1 Tax=Arachidicoccus sp. BS20 TaxID=1850526 RepID=UPI0007F15178|nr:hypothetical protein [Arachidicoccus sp. BS20]ANI88429.1 hypothetical protein A9P82_03390 [Arachidicoccus sp. BS20]
MPKKFNNMDNEEFDKLFRQSAEDFTPPSAPEGAWDNFYENKLSDKKKKKGWLLTNIERLLSPFIVPKLSWQFATTGVLIIVAGIWLSMNNTTNLHQAVQTQKIIAEGPKQQLQIEQDNDTGVLNENDDHSNIVAENGIYTAKRNNKSSSQEIFRQVSIVPNTNKNSNIIYNLPEKSGLIKMNTDIYNNVISGRKNSIDSINTRRYVLDNNPNKTINKQPAQQPDLKGFFAVDDDENTKNHNDARWQVGVVGGSNVSVIHGNVSGNPGLNTGVMVQRRINESRLSVEAGIVRESMAYDVDNADFHPNGKTISSEVSNINGTCTMVDVPVNIRYDVVHTKKSNAFVSTGVSTTWMANQNYTYQYTADNGNTTQVSRDVSGQGKNVYAVTNVSIGFEQHFKNTSVQVAPYVKIPLGGIGYGNMNLGSVGAQISIKKSF